MEGKLKKERRIVSIFLLSVCRKKINEWRRNKKFFMHFADFVRRCNDFWSFCKKILSLQMHFLIELSRCLDTYTLEMMQRTKRPLMNNLMRKS